MFKPSIQKQNRLLTNKDYGYGGGFDGGFGGNGYGSGGGGGAGGRGAGGPRGGPKGIHIKKHMTVSKTQKKKISEQIVQFNSFPSILLFLLCNFNYPVFVTLFN